ncbi:MAG TPA: hypothetical protein VGO50_01020 [Pyrinomonadaceae bacterium]|jgi:hypothetical protein|nr:hypothetical protein [Pyrinomonadaceae bacterium]
MNRFCNKNRRGIYGRAGYLTTITLAVLIFALTGSFSASFAGRKDQKVFSEEAGLDSLFSFLSEKKELAGSSDLTNELGRFLITDPALGLGDSVLAQL